MKKRTLNKLMALGLAASMVLGMAACGSSGDTKEEGQGTAESTTASEGDTATADVDSGDKIVVGVDLYYRRDEYYVDLETTFRAYGEEKGYEMVISDADGDVTTQISQIEDFITQGVDVILLAAADPTALIPACQDAIDAGIPVICYDGGIDSDIPATKVIFDYYEDGAMVAEWAKQYITDNLGGKAKVAILDFPASPIVCGLRAQGFAETISQLDGVEIVAQQDGKASRTDAMAVMENILTANPDVDLVYGINYDTGAGAASAIEAAGSKAVVCCNAWGQEGFEKLENDDPYIKCMAASSPVTQAHDAIDTIAPALAGEELPKETLSHSTLLTAETIKDFDWQSIVAARK